MLLICLIKSLISFLTFPVSEIRVPCSCFREISYLPVITAVFSLVVSKFPVNFRITGKSGRGLQNWRSEISLIFGADFRHFRKTETGPNAKSPRNRGQSANAEGVFQCQETSVADWGAVYPLFLGVRLHSSTAILVI